MLNEEHIVHLLQKEFPEQIGDDAAILPLSNRESYVISKDLLLEDIHFRSKYQTPKSLAHKSLHVNLSDLAAMGASPRYILLGISVPTNYRNYINSFLKSFSQACKKQNVILIGGDTTKSSRKLFISITAIGIIKNANIKLRKNASTGDLICLAGEIGRAHLGFLMLEKQKNGGDLYKKAFLYPKALIQEGLWFGAQKAVTSLMDVSDGLYLDLKRLCQFSKVAAQVNLDFLKITNEYASKCKNLSIDPLLSKLEGGEDYSLLLTIKNNSYKKISSAFHKNFSYKLKVLGKITEGKSINFVQKGITKNLNVKSFSHFKEL